MPIYEYQCDYEKCKAIQEVLHGINEKPLIECTLHCTVVSCSRVMSCAVGRVVGGVERLTTSKIDKNVTKK